MKIRVSFSRFVMASLVMTSTTVCAQTATHSAFSAFQHKLKSEVFQYKPGVVTNAIVSRSGKTTVNRIDMTKQVNIIVEFKGEPMFLQKFGPPSSRVPLSSYTQRQTQFKSDLVSMHTAAVKGLKVTLSTPIVTREYSKVFYGAAVTVPRAMVSQIASLSYVKRVFVDRKVKALLIHSVHQIRADSVWKKFGTEGKGVLVGEIDTGIDYDDSALGGGIGPGYKVVGGYNFINNSANPMDDNGHGTHVAGIIAADGANLKGVAPLAKLMAFKALDQNGSGTESNVIAAIDRCADPNNDGNDSDKVNIVNMSIGGNGGPDDAVSAAVDSAVELGITFCVAAGNSGSAGYYTIGSPGTARLAITVGAVDSTDNLAPFSSRGPDGGICIIKPDIVAPGVNITSTYLNNTEATFSGTSMATPFVTGVCALLKSLHKTWSPATIKSAIMTTAVNIGQDVMAQGAGRVDALNAAEVSAFAYPPDLSFGFDSSAANDWTEVDTMWVANSDSVGQSFSMLFENVPTGVSISATPSTFSLASGDSQAVVVSLSVDNSVVPYPEKGPLAFSGEAYLNGTRDTLHIPWAFVKAARVMFTFNQPDPAIFVSDTNASFDESDADWLDPYDAQFVMPKGEYDLLAIFGGPTVQRIVVKEHLDLHGSSHVSVISTDATNRINFGGVDANGQPFSSYPSTMRSLSFEFPDSSLFRFLLDPGLPDSVFCSNFSSRFMVAAAEFANNQLNEVYDDDFDTLAGMDGNVTFTNPASAYYVEHIHADFPPYTGDYKEIDCDDNLFGTLPGQQAGEEGLEYKITGGFHGDWSGKLYITSTKSSALRFPISFTALDGPPADTLFEHQWFVTDNLQVYRDSVGVFIGHPYADTYMSPDGGNIDFAHAPIFPGITALNDIAGKSNILMAAGFYGALGSLLRTTTDTATYTIYNSGGGIVASGKVGNISGNGIDVSPGGYKFVETTQGYFIRGVQGKGTLTTTFNLAQSDPDPPLLTSLRLLNAENTPVDSLSTGGKGMLTFSATDLNSVLNKSGQLVGNDISVAADSTKLFYRLDGTTTWLPVSITQVGQDSLIGAMYAANTGQMSDYDSAAIDLRIDIQDQSGNTTQWIMDPAFCVGNYGVTTGIEQNTAGTNIPKVFTLYQNYPNPFNPATTIKYDIPKASHVVLNVYNVLGERVETLVDATRSPGHYTVTFDASRLASGVYFCRIQAGSFVQVKKVMLIK